MKVKAISTETAVATGTAVVTVITTTTAVVTTTAAVTTKAAVTRTTAATTTVASVVAEFHRTGVGRVFGYVHLRYKVYGLFSQLLSYRFVN